MEHIRHSIVGPTGQSPEPLRVIGAVNETLKSHPAGSEISAVAWQPPTVILRSSSPAASAIIQQQQSDIIAQTNDVLRRRYGGPLIERLVVRMATGQ